MRTVGFFLMGACVLFWTAVGAAAGGRISEATQECLDCHASFHPGIVEGWRDSRHAAVTPAAALERTGLALKISAREIPDHLRDVSPGCAECHTLRADEHADTFDHNGYAVHVVVTPDDCRTCHSLEAEQFSKNLMAHARQNLAGNAVYQDLQRSIIGRFRLDGQKLLQEPASAEIQADTCYYCHGTRLTVNGLETRETPAGEMDFPIIEGWPNQGVGRENPDGSLGTCSACHSRHGFSIETARKPYTCKECHIGPDVPAFKVYSASKHGNIFSSRHADWDFQAVPWTVGRDFTAPTCAACHISLLADTDGFALAERTHQMNDRLPWRLFGLIYAHPHPKEADTTVIHNADGLPLPTDFKGNFAQEFLIDENTRQLRRNAMQNVCLSCHHTSWVRGHWRQLEASISETNSATRVATDLMGQLWQTGRARGLADSANPFDETDERLWCDIWLFYANTIRFSTAMGGGGDYSTFADGRYFISQRIQALKARLDAAQAVRP